MSGRDELDRAIIAAYREVSRGLDRDVLPVLIERGITMAQLKALMAVNAADETGVTVTALGNRLAIGQPSASLLVEQLVKQGLAKRVTDPADRRRAIVTASPEGEELTAELRRGRRSVFAEWLGRLSDEDAETLAHGLRALAAAGKNPDAPGPGEGTCDKGTDQPLRSGGGE
jgi:DNA-binding MarR family transcriptional regulator